MRRTQSSRQREYIKRVDDALKVKEKVDIGQKIIGEVGTVNKVISDTIYIKDNVAVDLKNFSLISVTEQKDIL